MKYSMEIVFETYGDITPEQLGEIRECFAYRLGGYSTELPFQIKTENGKYGLTLYLPKAMPDAFQEIGSVDLDIFPEAP